MLLKRVKGKRAASRVVKTLLLLLALLLAWTTVARFGVLHKFSTPNLQWPLDWQEQVNSEADTLGIILVVNQSIAETFSRLLFHLSLQENKNFLLQIDFKYTPPDVVVNLYKILEESNLNSHQVIHTFQDGSPNAPFGIFKHVERYTTLEDGEHVLTRTFVGDMLQCTLCNISHTIKQEVEFVVITSIFRREYDPQFIIPQLTSLRSIKNQEVSSWFAILVGDGVDASDQGAVSAAIKQSRLPPKKFLIVNSYQNHREMYLYDREDIWGYAGINAGNLGLVLAYKMNAKYTVRIDNDDVWLKNHLTNLRVAYEMFPNATFAFTSASGYLDQPAFPSDSSGAIYLRRPEPCGLIHATVSWSTRLRIFYRHEWEQLASPRGLQECCGVRCISYNVTLPADADLWERVAYMVQTGLAVSVYVGKVDVIYSDVKVKGCLQNFIVMGNTTEKCKTMLSHINLKSL